MEPHYLVQVWASQLAENETISKNLVHFQKIIFQLFSDFLTLT